MLSLRLDPMSGRQRYPLTTIQSIRDWYKGQPPWVQKVNFWVLLLFTLGLFVGLTKSGPEFRAIVWHYRHGNHVTVNGVTFPVYYWYAPDDRGAWLHVFDQPGPLRPTDDQFTMFTIDGRRHKDDVGTPEELVQREMHRHSGYPDLSRFQWSIRSEPLECMQERKGWLSVVFCYGDGPIYSVFFNGNGDALNRLRRAISEAK
jgi:hypothetical protein